ncbi:hypothetical protein BGW36DRAFT_432432 [Talaromyces proteolyticus]|uniref:Uncharacterized protein n=1 Tax=Talaromyces proteolyticus TaxID=1131652 RepID=A0AAD4PUX4_9EURO|nr:uncharacterized protein BGW36DRAFT_432432 [Talaromyces proteolyticus]KAH8690639.1 hypothetical protein BGW36DRAFT_432432 [Talaromyces proteolyticus]
MKSIILPLTFFFATSSNALVGISWNIGNGPSSGLTDITFPMNIANAPHTTGFYFAQQFGFNGESDVGYIGLQPRPDSGSNSVIHAAFSSFVSGTTTDDSNCSDGADGGAGVSCSIEINGDYSHTFDLVVQNTSGQTWTGTLVDTVTGQETHIGSWSLPSGASGIKSSQVGFVEYYPWNSGTHSCDQLPKTEVTFGIPTTTNSGAGSLGSAYEYGDCVGKVGFSSSQTSSGVEVTVGF